MNTSQIGFAVKRAQLSEDSLKYARVTLLINGVEVNGYLGLPELLAYTRSALSACRYYLFTCTCGVPGCAGVDDTIIQFNDEADKSVYWFFPKNSYDSLNSQTLKFDRNQFFNAVSQLRKELQELESEGFFYEHDVTVASRDEDFMQTYTPVSIDDYVGHLNIEPYEILRSRQLALYHSVSDLRKGLELVRLKYGDNETYQIEVLDLVTAVYDEFAKRLRHGKDFDATLFTAIIQFVEDAVENHGYFASDFLFLVSENDSKFSEKMLLSIIRNVFNTYARRDYKVTQLKSSTEITIHKVEE